MTTDLDWRVQQRATGLALRTLIWEYPRLGQADIADAMNITQSQMSDYLNARRLAPVSFEANFRKAVRDMRRGK